MKSLSGKFNTLVWMLDVGAGVCTSAKTRLLRVWATCLTTQNIFFSGLFWWRNSASSCLPPAQWTNGMLVARTWHQLQPWFWLSIGWKQVIGWQSCWWLYREAGQRVVVHGGVPAYAEWWDAATMAMFNSSDMVHVVCVCVCGTARIGDHSSSHTTCLTSSKKSMFIFVSFLAYFLQLSYDDGSF